MWDFLISHPFSVGAGLCLFGFIVGRIAWRSSKPAFDFSLPDAYDVLEARAVRLGWASTTTH